MLRLVVDENIPYMRGEAERLGEVTYLPSMAITPETVHDADVLIVRTRTRCDAKLLQGSRVRFVATATIGHDHIDVSYMQQAGIGWANCPGCNASSVAQYVRNVLLALADDGLLTMKDLCVGVVGVGHVGTRVVEALRVLGVEVLCCDPLRQARGEVEAASFLSLDMLLARCHVLTLHTPLTTEGIHATHHLITAERLAQAKHLHLLINTSRGEVVNNTDLLAALQRGQLPLAALDTWEHEPHIEPALLEACHIATPHIAGYSADGKAMATRMALTAVALHFGLNEVFTITPPPLPNTPPIDLSMPAYHLWYYDPREDTARLKMQPEAFESLRNNYWFRREEP
ncbi:MAG: 4-phosphoerythronate dehydrogenase [Bacteroidales bacterium]|nr:4-phosphoerythronate dehydrogenase [Bacteroidales bacterium]